MNDIDRLMEVIEVQGRLRDGGTCTIIANRQEVDRYNLEGGLYHPQYDILFILEDGKGKKLGAKNKGIPMPHLITGTKSAYVYKDDNPFNNVQLNMLSPKQKTTYRFPFQK